MEDDFTLATEEAMPHLNDEQKIEFFKNILEYMIVLNEELLDIQKAILDAKEERFYDEWFVR